MVMGRQARFGFYLRSSPIFCAIYVISFYLRLALWARYKIRRRDVPLIDFIEHFVQGCIEFEETDGYELSRGEELEDVEEGEASKPVLDKDCKGYQHDDIENSSKSTMNLARQFFDTTQLLRFFRLAALIPAAKLLSVGGIILTQCLGTLHLISILQAFWTPGLVNLGRYQRSLAPSSTTPTPRRLKSLDKHLFRTACVFHAIYISASSPLSGPPRSGPYTTAAGSAGPNTTNSHPNGRTSPGNYLSDHHAPNALDCAGTRALATYHDSELLLLPQAKPETQHQSEYWLGAVRRVCAIHVLGLVAGDERIGVLAVLYGFILDADVFWLASVVVVGVEAVGT